MATEDVLMIFLKYPEPGKVKTRLAKTIGSEAAAELYRLMAGDIIHRFAERKQYRTVIFFDPPNRASDVRGWLKRDLCYIRQSGKDLGERLANAFGIVFESGARRAVVIGTDCPDITHDVITRTLRYLDSRDVVLGPAEDGGYYLLGLSQFIPELFNSIDWSTDRVLSQTTAKVERMHLSVAILDTLKDIDKTSDLPPSLLSRIPTVRQKLQDGGIRG